MAECSETDIERAMQTMQKAEWTRTFNRKKQAERLNKARQAAKFFEGKQHPLLGKHVGSIPLNEYYFLKQKYGVQAMSDPEFMDWMRRRILKPEGLSRAS